MEMKLSVYKTIVLFFKSKSEYENTTHALLADRADKNNGEGLKLTSDSPVFGFTFWIQVRAPPDCPRNIKFNICIHVCFR